MTGDIITARHEAAHALAYLRAGQPFAKVVLYEHGGAADGMGWDALGGVIPHPGTPISTDIRVITVLAGPAADWRSEGGISDEQITRLAQGALDEIPFARELAEEWGEPYVPGDWETFAGLLSPGDWVPAWREAEAALDRDWAAVVAVADALLARGSLTMAEVASIAGRFQ